MKRHFAHEENLARRKRSCADTNGKQMQSLSLKKDIMYFIYEPLYSLMTSQNKVLSDLLRFKGNFTANPSLKWESTQCT